MHGFKLEESVQPKVTQSYDVKEWQTGYRSLREEFEYWVDDIEGEIPAELEGTLFRNGPGLFEINGHRYQHPFDGDGMICSIAFSNGRAYFRNRFVRTEAFIEEQEADRVLYRGVFGTQKPGGWLANAFDFRLKNIANTNVIYWGKKLLALWEAAEPHRLDPKTLDTIGKDYVNGAIQPGGAFAAHPRIDPACEMDGGDRCLVNFSLKPGLSTTLTIYELNPQGQLLRKHSHAVPGFAFIHDFAITPNYCIFFQNPVTFNPLPFVFGTRGAGECITFHNDRPTQIVIVPRNGSEPVQIIPTRSGFVFHHANAFEQNGKLYIDSICYESLPTVEADQDYREVDFAALSPGTLWRFEVDRTSNTVQRQELESRCCEFPFVHPQRVGRPYRYAYLGAAHDPTGNAPLQGILKADLETGDRQFWSAAPDGYVSEPIFVPRSPLHESHDNEDDGWLFTLVYNAKTQRSELIILDAKNLEQGAIARLKLKHHVPYGLHGSFTPDYFGA